MRKNIKIFLRITAAVLILLVSVSFFGGCMGKTPGQKEESFAPETVAGTPESAAPESGTPEPTELDDGVETVQGIVAAQESDIYGGPGNSYEKLGALSKGASVTIIGTSGGWHQIEYGDSIAYISADDIELDYTVDASSHTISRLAKNDLFPIAKSYSLDREIRPMYIMLHFCSAVVIDRKDPYNMALVRDNFIKNGVDTNYIIDRDGTIYCYVPEDRLAYHAGKGSYAGDASLTDNMNRYAIGIELLAIGSQKDMSGYLTADEYAALDPALIGYTDAQYDALKALIADICQRNNISADKHHILGHDEYTQRKTDPGELFDWERVLD